MFLLCFHYAVEIYLVLLWNRRRHWICKITITNWRSKKKQQHCNIGVKIQFFILAGKFSIPFLLNQPNKHKVCNKKQAQQSAECGKKKTNWKIEIISWKTSFNSVFFYLCKSSIKCMKKRESIREKEVSWHKKLLFPRHKYTILHT